MQRVLILGHSDPSRSGRPLSTRDGAGRRLFELSGMTEEEYEATFARANHFDGFVPTTGFDVVLVLGREVWRDLPWLPRNAEWFSRHGHYVLLPHPSGRNRILNSLETRMRFCQAMREAACRIVA